MRRRSVLLGAVGGTFGSLVGARSGHAETTKISLPIERYHLDNGLEVILHEDHATPIVTVNVWYRVGSKDEPQGKNGFAHLFEHLMFQGSKNVGEDMFFKYLERAGSSNRNGTTNRDRTNYYETIPANEVELALWLESDRMGFLLDHVDQKTFESQREVVKNERRQNYENAPYGFIGKFISAAVYPPEHPYHLLTIGSPEQLDAASLTDVHEFFKTYYVPNNACLVVAGDFEPGTVKELVKKYFGPLAKGKAPPLKNTPIPTRIPREVRLEVEAEVELPRLSITWTSPPRFAAGDAELDTLATVLASGRSSRLYKRMVYDMELAQDVSASQSSNLLGSMFEITVMLKKGKKLDEALKVVDEELAKLRSSDASKEELERARTRILSSYIFSVESVESRADRFNGYAMFAGDPDFFAKDMARFEKVSASDIKQSVAKWLPPDQRIVTFVRPTAGAPRAGRLKAGGL